MENSKGLTQKQMEIMAKDDNFMHELTLYFNIQASSSLIKTECRVGTSSIMRERLADVVGEDRIKELETQLGEEVSNLVNKYSEIFDNLHGQKAKEEN